MQKHFMLTMLFLAFSSMALTQNTAPPTNPEGQSTPPSNGAMTHKGEMQSHLDWLSQQLNLTEDQKEKLKPILRDQHKQMKALEDDTSLTQDQKHEKMKQLHQSTHAQVEAILTPEATGKIQTDEERRHGT